MIAAALAQAGLPNHKLDLLATAAFKSDEPGIVAAAAGRGIDLILVARADLERAGGRATHAPRVAERVGVGSVAEAAALAAGGPAARLVLPRIAIGPATCALASSDPAIPGATP